jgi:hypothetical protein
VFEKEEFEGAAPQEAPFHRGCLRKGEFEGPPLKSPLSTQTARRIKTFSNSF